MTKSIAHQRGVSLIEALMALLVMAFGMLGIVGMQSTMRLNSDVAKQRSEAVRLAQQAIEDARSFVSVGSPVSGVANYSTISSAVQSINAGTGYLTNYGIQLAGYNTNTSYTLTSRVIESPAGGAMNSANPRLKSVNVQVSWIDRTGSNIGGTPCSDLTANQCVILNATIARVMPELEGTVALAAYVDSNGVPTRLPTPSNRNLAIPFLAVNLGNGTSALMPPQSSGGNVVWVFDNATALITACTTTASSNSALTIANSSNNCSGKFQLLSGYVAFGASNFATLSAAQQVAEALNPTGTALASTVTLTQTFASSSTVGCLVAAPQAGIASTAYYCAVPVSSSSTPALSWSGSTAVGGLTGAPTVCRYTTTASPVPNSQHPLAYATVNTPLAQQNFLVLPTASACPGVIAGAITTVSP